MTARRCGVLKQTLVLFLLAGLVGPGRALAETEAADLARARQQFDRGDLDYRMGRFRDALGQYQAALQLTRRPSILFNIAQCHRQLGELDRALFYYRLYLADSERARPGEPPPYRDEVQRRIEELQASLREQQARARPSATAASAAPPRALAVPPPPRRRGTLLGLGIGSVVLTAGAEALALAFTVKANGEYTDSSQFRRDRGVALGGHAAAGVFAVAAVVSFVLYLRAPPPDHPRSARWLGSGASFSF